MAYAYVVEVKAKEEDWAMVILTLKRWSLCIMYFISDIDAQQQILTTQYYSDSNLFKQLRRYPSTLYSVECGIYSLNVRR